MILLKNIVQSKISECQESTLNGKNTLFGFYQIISFCSLFTHKSIEDEDYKNKIYDKYLQSLEENNIELSKKYFNYLMKCQSQDRKHIHEFLNQYEVLYKDKFSQSEFQDVYEDDVIGVLSYEED